MRIVFKEHAGLKVIFSVENYPIPRVGEFVTRDSILYTVEEVAYDYDDYECRVYLKQD